ncbi:MAG: cytochrome P450 [Halieaceae bacterium]|nr:cytochrome P450 [Halieaceae bacterium]
MTIASSFRPVGAPYDDVYSVLRKSREEEPVFYSEELQSWVVTRYDDIMDMLNDPTFTNEGTLSGFNYEPETEAILSSGINWNQTAHINGVEGAEHSRFKKILLPILSPKRQRGLEPMVREIAVDLIEGFRDKGSCEFINEFAYLLPILTMFRFIGFNEQEDDLEQLAKWSGSTFKMWLTPMDAEEQKECAQQAVNYQRYIRDKLDDRRRNPRDDLMTEMVTAMDRGEIDLSEDELVLMYIFTFIGAGHETTMAQLGNALYQLLKEPERWQFLLENLDNVDDVVEESIRYDGSVLCWYRRVAEDTEFKGFQLKQGQFVVMAFGSGNHDECRFEDAESYCPVRANRERPLTFSRGRHFCLGAPLARLEVQVALQELAQRLPGIRLTPGQQISMAPSVATRAIERLEVEW